jgi:small-conductance mechanosensitive channel
MADPDGLVDAVMSNILVRDLLLPALAMAGAVTAVTLAYHLLRRLSHRSRLARDLVRRVYRPSQAVVALGAAGLVLWHTAEGDWRGPTLHGILLAIIAVTAWLIVALVDVLAAMSLRRLRLDELDPLAARRIRTRISVVHRVTLATVSVLAIGVMLVTFEEVRTIGASVLVSAGVIGVVAALAAQSTLSNLFAGLQVAFGDSLRLDDVVVVEGEWGWIEEITLRHVVVKIWDERRLILPTSYFTANPFQNWTKSERQLLGTVEFDVDWSAPFDPMREELQRIVKDTDLWDGRACGLEVIDATGSLVRVRAVISAADSTAQWALRCLVREKLVSWLQRTHPTALPRVRTEFGDMTGSWNGTGRPPAAPASRPPAAVRQTAAGS